MSVENCELSAPCQHSCTQCLSATICNKKNRSVMFICNGWVAYAWICYLIVNMLEDCWLRSYMTQISRLTIFIPNIFSSLLRCSFASCSIQFPFCQFAYSRDLLLFSVRSFICSISHRHVFARNAQAHTSWAFRLPYIYVFSFLLAISLAKQPLAYEMKFNLF